MNIPVFPLYSFKTFLCCLLLISASSAWSATLLNGIARHTEFGEQSFIGALFTTELSKSSKAILQSDADKELQVRVLANRLSARRFRRMWIEGLAVNAPRASLEAQSQNMVEFSNMLKVNLTQGDIISIQRSTESVRILINGTELGQIDDPAFFDLLLRVWLGPVPLSSQFRKNLLAAGQFSPELENEFQAIKPSEERIISVAAALKDFDEEEKSVAKPEESSEDENVSSQRLALNSEPDISKAAEKPKPKPKPAPNVRAPVPELKPKAVAATVTTPAITEPVITEPFESIVEREEEALTTQTLLAQQDYTNVLKRWIYKNLSYPKKSVSKGQEGIVRVSVTINREGELLGVELKQVSEYKRLDLAAIKAVERSAPFPGIPSEIKKSIYTVGVPISFKLR
jgi:TonB family protein